MTGARGNQTEMAVLGALSIEPMTGYALREVIRDVLGHFWSESFGQIYPVLAKLERDGYVTRKGSTRAGSSMFDITPSGAQWLRNLLGQPIQVTPPRNGLLLRLFFGRALGVETCRALITQAKADAQRRLDEFDTIASQVTSETQHPADKAFLLLTISAGQHSARATLSWADESLTILDTMKSDTPGKDGTQ